MTGARIDAVLDDGMIRAALGRVEKLTSDFAPLLKRVGVGLVRTTQERFVAGHDPQGQPWKPLNPLYADGAARDAAHAAHAKGMRAAKKSGGPPPDANLKRGFKQGPGILRERAMRGGLMGSITFRVEGPRTVAIGSNKVYAAIHQFGGVIKPKSKKSLAFWLGGRLVLARQVTIPARPYLGIGEADRQMIMDQYAFTMQELLRGA